MWTAEKRLNQRIVHIHSYGNHPAQNNGQLGLVRTTPRHPLTSIAEAGMIRFWACVKMTVSRLVRIVSLVVIRQFFEFLPVQRTRSVPIRPGFKAEWVSGAGAFLAFAEVVMNDGREPSKLRGLGLSPRSLRRRRSSSLAPMRGIHHVHNMPVARIDLVVVRSAPHVLAQRFPKKGYCANRRQNTRLLANRGFCVSR